MTPIISLITITYNSAKTLRHTIDSIRSQTYREMEYIIVDGGSTDGTLDVIEENNDLVTKWVSEPDGGIYDAINKGIAMASGEYVGLLHADDMLANNGVLKAIYHAIDQHRPDALYGDLDYISAGDNARLIRRWISSPFHPIMLKRGWMPPHPTLYVKREWFNRIGNYNSQMKIAADYDFILRLFSKPNLETIYLPQCLVKMRVGGASNRSIKNIIIKMKEDYQAIKNNHIGGLATLLVKNFSKVGQFFNKKQQ